MWFEGTLKILKDYFTFNIPLGVVIIIIVVIMMIFTFMYKQIKSGFQIQIKEYRETHNMFVKNYEEQIKQKEKRISSLEKRLDNKFKGGKGK